MVLPVHCTGKGEQNPRSNPMNGHTPNPKQDVAEYRANDVASADIERTNKSPQEGFTVHRDLEPIPIGSEDVWLVGAISTNQTEPINKDDMIEFYEEYLPVLRDFSGIRLGGYHFAEGGKWSLDLSIAVTDRDEAEALGEQLNQESVFNIGTCELVMTEGNGNSPVQDTQDLRNILTNVESLAPE